MPPYYPLVISLLDCAAVLLSYGGAALLFTGAFIEGYAPALPFFLMAVVLLLQLRRGYTVTEQGTMAALMGRAALPCVITGVAAIVFSFAVRAPWGLPLLGAFLLFSWLLLTIRRIAVFAYVRREEKKGRFAARLLIVGTGERARRIAGACEENPDSGITVVGFLSDRQSEIGTEISFSEVMGLREELQSILQRNKVDALYFEDTPDGGEGFLFTRSAQGCNLPGVERLLRAMGRFEKTNE